MPRDGLSDGDERPATEAYRAFRPRAARFVGIGLAVAVPGFMVALAVLLPRVAPARDSWGDRAGLLAFGLLVAWVVLRHAGVRAVPDDEGLVVRNLVRTTRLGWAEVHSVRFGPDRPWVQLDLADGTTLAVMAVQQADGAYARREARRLATLVDRHSRTERDD
ncbi:PH domain-containing protein [Cellulomonas sp. APG4]|uniref:PH domain-containing protein n=1 Tax=Cellulomonas sp. APG4 TaxID=1538656 RepID=UPI00192A4273|nr:PH domain-containing protein [Cellulomonas sp. APG4]